MITLTTDRPSSRDGLILTAAEAAERIPSASTVAVGGSGSLLQVPETMLEAIGQRFVRQGSPRNLRVVHTMGLGDHRGRGLDHLSSDGLTMRFVGSHFVLSPRQQRMIAENRVEAFGLPAGTISLLYREIAARRPGLFTDIGLGTYVDPRQSAARMNSCTTTSMSEIITINGQEWLFYPRFDIDVAIIRASAADPDGNLSMDDEAAFSDNLAIAQAAHNSGGIVIAEVKRVLPARSIPASRTRMPGALVDHVVVTTHPNQTPITEYDPTRTGVHPNTDVTVAPLPMSHRKVIARRAAMELRQGQLVNLGVGMANGISYVALEEQFLHKINLSVEQGIFGGLPGVGLDSGTAINPSAITDMSSQFDLYDGGALDFAGLAFAQVDARGNVNVTSVGSTPIGPGGFIDISQKAGVSVFCGTFRGGGLDLRIEAGKLDIAKDGRYPKFVDRVEHITFNADLALQEGRRAVYVTERAVFELCTEGLELIEIAPGIDLQRDILDLLPFRPVLKGKPRLMDSRLFREEPMRWHPAPAAPPTLDNRSPKERQLQ